MDLAERVKQKLADQKAEIKPDEKPVGLNFKPTKKKPVKEEIISLKDDFVRETNEIESFIELLPELDIDDVSSIYRLYTGKKRIHTKGSITTKNYMINAVIKRLELSKTKKKVNK